MSIVIPRKYFSDKVIEAKLEECYGKIKEITDFFDGYKFNRENIAKFLIEAEGMEGKEASIKEATAVLENKKLEGKQTLEQVKYWTDKIDKWEAIKNTTEDVVIDDIDEIESL